MMVTIDVRRSLGRHRRSGDPHAALDIPHDEIDRRADGWPGLSRIPRTLSCVPGTLRKIKDDFAEWAEQHPNANEQFDVIVKMARGKKIGVFLDYDGTLTPIVRDPDRAVMSDEMRAAVRNVARVFPTAIISGRGREKVQDFVRLDELYYAGSHGMDIMGPNPGTEPQNGKRGTVGYQPAASFASEINAVHDELVAAVAPIHGATVEHNKFCLSVHFRNCHKDVWEELRNVVETVVARHNELTITRGRKVLEVRPRVKWDKGRAVQYLSSALGLEGKDVLSVYVGDDKTDEDAFKVVKSEPHGLGILVSTIPKPTQAMYHLQDPAEVLTFLVRLAAIAQGSANGSSVTPGASLTLRNAS